jgi:cell division protein FtsZ
MIELPSELKELRPRISVIGVGGAGGNAVESMIRGDSLGIDFVVANTDAQALRASNADTVIQLGRKTTAGLGAGSSADLGRAAAEESLPAIEAMLSGTHMCFITAGLGGGTGTGAAPVIARVARDLGILTVGVVTKPFRFEGKRRARPGRDRSRGAAKACRHADRHPERESVSLADAGTTF